MPYVVHFQSPVNPDFYGDYDGQYYETRSLAETELTLASMEEQLGINGSPVELSVEETDSGGDYLTRELPVTKSDDGNGFDVPIDGSTLTLIFRRFPSPVNARTYFWYADSRLYAAIRDENLDDPALAVAGRLDLVGIHGVARGWDDPRLISQLRADVPTLDAIKRGFALYDIPSLWRNGEPLYWLEDITGGKMPFEPDLHFPDKSLAYTYIKVDDENRQTGQLDGIGVYRITTPYDFRNREHLVLIDAPASTGFDGFLLTSDWTEEALFIGRSAHDKERFWAAAKGGVCKGVFPDITTEEWNDGISAGSVPLEDRMKLLVETDTTGSFSEDVVNRAFAAKLWSTEFGRIAL